MAADKRENEPGDVVLVHLDGKPTGYARVESIRRHDRPGWHECDLLFLSQPPQPVTWILEREQIDGAPFTMGGRPVRIERLPEPGDVHAQRTGESQKSASEDAAPKVPKRKRRDNVVALVRKPTSE